MKAPRNADLSIGEIQLSAFLASIMKAPPKDGEGREIKGEPESVITDRQGQPLHKDAEQAFFHSMTKYVMSNTKAEVANPATRYTGKYGLRRSGAINEKRQQNDMFNNVRNFLIGEGMTYGYHDYSQDLDTAFSYLANAKQEQGAEKLSFNGSDTLRFADQGAPPTDVVPGQQVGSASRKAATPNAPVARPLSKQEAAIWDVLPRNIQGHLQESSKREGVLGHLAKSLPEYKQNTKRKGLFGGFRQDSRLRSAAGNALREALHANGLSHNLFAENGRGDVDRLVAWMKGM